MLDFLIFTILAAASMILSIFVLVVCAWFAMFGVEMAFNLWELIQRKTRRPF